MNGCFSLFTYSPYDNVIEICFHLELDTIYFTFHFGASFLSWICHQSSIHPMTKKKRVDFEMEAFSSTSNISAKSLSNLQAKIELHCIQEAPSSRSQDGVSVFANHQQCHRISIASF